MTIEKYIKPNSINEAYDILKKEKKSVILGGGLFLRMQKNTIPVAVDCMDLLSDQIDLGDEIIIGAMTSLRAIECFEGLPEGLRESVAQISGVGTRNIATIGGSICGRYPFSDINTALVALNAKLEFHHAGLCDMYTYNNNGLKEKDILLKIHIPKCTYSNSSYYKKVYTDFSMVNLTIVDHRIAVGARPGRAVLLENVDFNRSAKDILSDIEFRDDFKASGPYRRALAEAKLEDMLKDLGGFHGN
jgi:CO/xanthine dehydrogenase FAD-binding subunit